MGQCAWRFLRWVPGLVPLRCTCPGHEISCPGRASASERRSGTQGPRDDWKRSDPAEPAGGSRMTWAMTVLPLVLLVLGFPIFVILLATSAIVIVCFYS